EKRGVAMALHNLATVGWSMGSPDHGRAHFEAALAMLRQVGDRVTEALCLPALASALLRTGEPARAIARLREALGLVREFDMAREAVFALEALAEWLTAAGRVAAAARLLAAAAAARVKLGTP